MSKIERRLVGEAIPVDERTIQPVAQVAGWHGSGEGETVGLDRLLDRQDDPRL